jgi:hypothetical protein
VLRPLVVMFSREDIGLPTELRREIKKIKKADRPSA